MSVESCDDIIPEGQDNLVEDRHAGYETIDELKCAPGTDNNDPGSVEYHYIDDTNPTSDHQAIEENQSEANDYEDIAGTNPAYDYIQAINEPLTLTSKCMKDVVFLVPTFASVTLSIIAGFLTSLMFHTLVLPRKISLEDGRITAEAGTTFIVFSSLAAASCGPLVIRFGFRKVALAGSVLLICISLSSSVTTTADNLSILFGIMGGLAVGHLRTLGVVAIVDHLFTHQTLALIVSHTGFTMGNVWSIFGLKKYDWHIDRRVFGMIAVMGLIAGCCLQRTSQAQENVTMLFKHPLFYFLISITLAASVGLSILQAEIIIFDYFVSIYVSQILVLVVLSIIWIFQKKKLKESYLFSMGISVVALGIVAMVHQDVFYSRASVMASSSLLGAVIAFTKVMLPLALVNTTGRKTLKLSLPLLVCLDEMGRVIGGSIQASTSSSPVNAALYCAGVSLIIAGVGAITAAAVIKRWPSLSDQAEAEDPVQDQVQETENHVEDRVQEEEDRVEDCAQEAEDRVGDCAQDAEDHVEDRALETEDRAQDAEDRVRDRALETEDRAQEAENRVGDRALEIEDRAQEAEDHGGDRALETEDRVEDRAQEAEGHVMFSVDEAETPL
ncbi:uncharacterized protein LOC124292004 [Haliotis rubra]|uniref:uncharacterized protein LOC124292004 n=1 Tax=Haliotis rubra TaxID=36100 RepID=UPI001EE629D1|nr:uncharacterized protein LOC124292004 [Haliotis rubra]